MEKINLAEKFSRFAECWSPKIVGELNDSFAKVGFDHLETLPLERLPELNLFASNRLRFNNEFCTLTADKVNDKANS